MTLVVDASVAIKWFFEEEQSTPARALMDRGVPLIAPSLVVAEMANAVWKRYRRGQIERDDADRSVALLAGPFSNLYPIEDLLADAAQTALDLNHPIYDCFYIALATRTQAPLVSADRRLLEAAQRTSVDVERLA